MNPKALYIFTPGFAANAKDTTCIPFLQQFCLSIKQLSPETPVVIFAFQYPQESGEYEWNGMRVIAFGGNDRKGIYRLWIWLKICFKFYSLKKEMPPAGIFSIWLTECAFLGTMIAKVFSLKHYTWIVGQDARASNRYVKLIRPTGEELIAFSTFIQQQMAENFGLLPGHIIRNGINRTIFPSLNTGQRTVSVIGVGSLISLKNFGLFIEIIEQVHKRGLIKRAVIIGEGPERENLKALIYAKKMQDVIALTGLLDHAKTLQWMNESRILLHTSEYDSNATILHEALYAGCTVISTCPVDPVPADNFYLIKDKESLVNKVSEVVSGPDAVNHRVVTNMMIDSARKVLELFY